MGGRVAEENVVLISLNGSKKKVILLKHFALPFSSNLLQTITNISYYHELAVHANRRH